MVARVVRVVDEGGDPVDELLDGGEGTEADGLALGGHKVHDTEQEAAVMIGNKPPTRLGQEQLVGVKCSRTPGFFASRDPEVR